MAALIEVDPDFRTDWLHAFLILAFEISLFVGVFLRAPPKNAGKKPTMMSEDESPVDDAADNSDAIVEDQKQPETAGFSSTTRVVEDLHAEANAALLQLVPDLVDSFMAVLDSTSQEDWVLMSSKHAPPLQIYQSPTNAFSFRVQAVLDNSAETVFDLLTDTENRPQWDEMMDYSKVVAQIGPSTRIVYIRLKAIWPTAARDMLLLSHAFKFADEDGHAAYVNITRSVDHPLDPRPASANDDGKIVRMHSKLAGQLVRKSRDTMTKSNLLQLADGDPGGWIPSSVAKFAATQAIPNTVIKVNEIVSNMRIKNRSVMIDGIEVEDKDFEIPDVQPDEPLAPTGGEHRPRDGLMERATPYMIAAILCVQLMRLALVYRRQ